MFFYVFYSHIHVFYNYGPNKTGVTYWRCVIRNKHNYCRATIIQRDGAYTRGLHQHNHAPKAGHLTARVIALKVR